MADQLATPADLASAVQADVDTASAVLAIEIATAVVQAACGGQRIVLVTDDEEEVWGGTEQVLRLKQRPVKSIASVTYAGSALSEGTASGTWRRSQYGLWRDLGWTEVSCEPSLITVVYTHGYAADEQDIQLGRGTTLSLAKGLFQSPDGVVIREQIDDYAVAYAEVSAALDASSSLKGLLRRQYGPKARMVSVM